MPAPRLGDYDPLGTWKYPPPSAGITDAPNVTVTIACAWVPHIAGVLESLLDDVWLGTDEEILLAENAIRKLLVQLQCVPLPETPPEPTEFVVGMIV